MYKDHIEYIIGIRITHTIGKNAYITHMFFKPSSWSMNLSQNHSRAVIMISPNSYRVKDFSMYTF